MWLWNYFINGGICLFSHMWNTINVIFAMLEVEKEPWNTEKHLHIDPDESSKISVVDHTLLYSKNGQ